MQGWRNMKMFDNIWKLVGVPVITVQLRYDGWVTEMQEAQQAVHAGNSAPAQGLDNLLYSADADFSCFADLALTSPVVISKMPKHELRRCEA